MKTPEIPVVVNYPKENISSPEAMKVVVQAIIECMKKAGVIEQ